MFNCELEDVKPESLMSFSQMAVGDIGRIIENPISSYKDLIVLKCSPDCVTAITRQKDMNKLYYWTNLFNVICTVKLLPKGSKLTLTVE